MLVLGAERRPAYDRVALTSFFEVGAKALSLLPGGRYEDPRVTLRTGAEVVAVSPRQRIITLNTGEDPEAGTRAQAAAVWNGRGDKPFIFIGDRRCASERDVFETLSRDMEQQANVDRFAAKHNVTVQKIQATNKIPDPAKLKAGQVLVIPAAQ